MKFATSLPWAGEVATPGNIVRFAQAAEKAGFDRVLVGEHMLYPRVLQSAYPYTKDGVMPPSASPMRLEMFTTFAYLAGLTTKLRFQSSVAILPLRSPVLTAKMVATLDYLSGGRMLLEVGVGWMREEYEALGVPFERRGRLLEEYLAVIRNLFAGGEAYQGEFLTIPAVDFAPKPVQDPFPISIGCGLVEAAMRRVARCADGWSPIGATVPQIEAVLPQMEGYLQECGRSLADLEVSIPVGGGAVQETPAPQLIEELRGVARIGAGCLAVNFGQRSATDLSRVLEALDWFGSEVAPHVD